MGTSVPVGLSLPNISATRRLSVSPEMTPPSVAHPVHRWRCIARIGLLVIASVSVNASSAVAGIDAGSVNSVVAVARRGGIDIIANEASRRQTPSIVGFDEQHRLLGESAASQRGRNPENFVTELRSLLGLDVEHLSDLLPDVVCVEDDGTPCVEVRHMRQARRYSAVQLFSMLLHHLQTIAEREHGDAIPECVIAVPLSYDASQRQAVLDAAAVSGIRCSRLILDVSLSRPLPSQYICPHSRIRWLLAHPHICL